MRLSHAGTFAVMVLLLSAMAGCAPVLLGSYVSPGTDFGALRTYNWASTESLATGDPRLDNNPFFHERVQQDVEKELAARGFEKIGTGTPKLRLHYHASVSQRLDLGGTNLPYRACDSCMPFMYDTGTLVLDFVDTRTNTLVWRAWAEESLGGAIDNQEWMEKQIDETVARLLEQLPRGL